MSDFRTKTLPTLKELMQANNCIHEMGFFLRNLIFKRQSNVYHTIDTIGVPRKGAWHVWLRLFKQVGP